MFLCWLERPVCVLLWMTSLSFISTDVVHLRVLKSVCCVSGITSLTHLIYESFFQVRCFDLLKLSYLISSCVESGLESVDVEMVLQSFTLTDVFSELLLSFKDEPFIRPNIKPLRELDFLLCVIMCLSFDTFLIKWLHVKHVLVFSFLPKPHPVLQLEQNLGVLRFPHK